MPFLRALSLGFLLVFVLALVGAAPPVARAQGTDAFTGEYYSNVSLNGAPTLTRQDAAIDFDWGLDAPAPGLPVDNFSVRWTRWYNVDPAGPYTFTIMSDDGSRLWVDGNLVVDMWYDHNALSRSATLDLTPGYHLIRMEYYDRAGTARARLAIDPAGSYPDWKGEYFDNAQLSGEPVITLNQPEINFDWGTKSPDIAVPFDHFSVRWTRTVYLASGTYRFSARMDDGMRVWIGGTLLIDQWKPQKATTYTADIALSAGAYPLRVEYYDDTGTALAQFSWAPAPDGAPWSGQYLNSPDLTGNPALTRKDPELNFNWGTNGPGRGISGASFSARWDSARQAPVTGFYTVYATADDGVRVSVDGKSLIDEWRDQAPTLFGATVYLTAGPHNWHVEYYQHLGGASLSVEIVQGVAPPSLASDDIVIEPKGQSWLASGNPANWHTSPDSRGGNASWALNNAFSLPLYNWARWYPSLPQAGNYEVQAYIPGNLATTRNARYWIAHDGSMTVTSLAQALYKDEWISLGTYYFSANGDEYVTLSDVTYECASCYTVVWDALKFSPR